MVLGMVICSTHESGYCTSYGTGHCTRNGTGYGTRHGTVYGTRNGAGYGAPIRPAPAYRNPQLPLAIDLIKESPNSSSSAIVIISCLFYLIKSNYDPHPHRLC